MRGPQEISADGVQRTDEQAHCHSEVVGQEAIGHKASRHAIGAHEGFGRADEGPESGCRQVIGGACFNKEAFTLEGFSGQGNRAPDR